MPAAASPPRKRLQHEAKSQDELMPGETLRSWKAGFAGKIQPIKLSSPIA